MRYTVTGSNKTLIYIWKTESEVERRKERDCIYDIYLNNLMKPQYISNRTSDIYISYLIDSL